MQLFWSYIIGPTEPALFAACIFFAALGIFFVLLLGTRMRDKSSPYSPMQFSWAYMWSDNARRIYASVIAVMISLRFLPELFPGLTLSPLIAFGIGTAWDGLALIIKQKTNFLDPKPKP